MYPAAFLAAPCPNNTEPVMVETKIETTSNAKLDSKRNLMAIFALRTHQMSAFRGARSSRVSDIVTSTAPATRAAGAPIFAVHSLFK